MFIVVNLDVILHKKKHILTHSMSGQQPTQMSYEKMLTI